MSQTKLSTPLVASLPVAAAITAAYLVWAPPSADLAAQTFRAELFAERGFVLWTEAWYGGFHVPGYSVVFPPLAALVGVRIAGALAALAATALFALLARRRFADSATLASAWFAAGAAAWLFTGRFTFLLGAAIGLASLLALDGRRRTLAAGLAVLTALASPVAGAFAALAGAALAIAGSRRDGLVVAIPAAATTVALGLAFPTLGGAPFALSSFVAIPIFAVVALLVLPTNERVLRVGVALYGLAGLLAFVVSNPLGGNVVRLGALFAGPVAALCLRPRPVLLIVLALPLAYWQLQAPVRDTAAGLGDPSTEAAFHAPLLDELDRRGAGEGEAGRIHVPPTRNRWEAVHVAERYPLARGWLRQLESDDLELFEDGGLTADTYRDWLDEHGIGWVAVAGADLDRISEDEVALIESDLDFLEPVWESRDWRLYRVDESPGLVGGAGAATWQLERLGRDRFAAEGEPGRQLLRLRWTPYWRLQGARACVNEADGWTALELLEPGRVELVPRLSLAGALGRSEICSE